MAQLAAVGVGVGQSPKKQAISSVASFHALAKPDVRSAQPAVISLTTIPGNFSRSWTIVPSSISLKTSTASVTTDSAASKISVGNVAATLITSENVSTISRGRSEIKSGTWPDSSWVTKFLASFASVVRVWIISQGMLETSLARFLDQRRPRTIVLGKLVLVMCKKAKEKVESVQVIAWTLSSFDIDCVTIGYNIVADVTDRSSG